MVAIAINSVNHEGYMATVTLSGLDTSKAYDALRVMEPPARENERRYQVLAHRTNWMPRAATVVIRDYEAPLRPYRVMVWDASATSPVDWDFGAGGYAGPPPVAVSDVISIDPPECGILIRSNTQPGFAVSAQVSTYGPIRFPARIAEHQVIGNRFPILIMDRREGRKSDELVVYTATLTESRRMQDLLIPESGRIYPLWVRSSSEDKLLFHDILMVPGDIAVEPVSHRRPWAKFFRIPFTEIDPRGLVPERTNDGVTAQPPDARIAATPTSGRAPLTVHLTDASTGNISSRVWDLNTASDAYGTSTSATPTVTYKRPGTYTIRLTVTGALGVDVTTVKVKVT